MLDVALTRTLPDLDQRTMAFRALHDECVVAAALHAERRSAERGIGERTPMRGDAIECAAHVRWQEEPRARRVGRVQADRLGRAPPLNGE